MRVIGVVVVLVSMVIMPSVVFDVVKQSTTLRGSTASATRRRRAGTP
jgi:hypothetical protein